MPAVVLRPVVPCDADDVWRIFQAVVAGGDTYYFPPGTGRTDAIDYLIGDFVTFVAELNDAPPPAGSNASARVVGVYKLVPNHPGLGSHVANASFMVDPAARGKGVGRAMGEHCLAQARQAGYEAMQFNFVVSTNTTAVDLWKKIKL